MTRYREPEISVRLLWPFARVTTLHPETINILKHAGVDVAIFANPESRVPYGVVTRMLDHAVGLTGDEALGLHAGEQLEAGDLDVVEYVARAQPTSGDCLRVLSQYFRILHDAMEIVLEPEGERTVVSFRVTGDLVQPPVIADFSLSAACAFARRNSEYTPPIEVRFVHAAPSYVDEYRRVFQTEVRFNAQSDALVLSNERLAAPMLRANARIATAFEINARQRLEKLRQGDGITGRVREAIAQRLGRGETDMASTARRFGMSVATLRRRLEAEGASFAAILDDLRRKLAERHLREGAPAVSEIALLLGFSSVPAFHRAFRRWTGVAPTEYRARVRSTNP